MLNCSVAIAEAVYAYNYITSLDNKYAHEPSGVLFISTCLNKQWDACSASYCLSHWQLSFVVEINCILVYISSLCSLERLLSQGCLPHNLSSKQSWATSFKGKLAGIQLFSLPDVTYLNLNGNGY